MQLVNQVGNYKRNLIPFKAVSFFYIGDRVQRDLQNVRIIRTGSKPPILPKSPRILRTPSVDSKHCDTGSVNIPTPIGKDSACDACHTQLTLNVNAGGYPWLFLFSLFHYSYFMRSTLEVPEQRKLSATSDYSTGSGSFGDISSFLKVQLPNTVNDGMHAV